MAVVTAAYLEHLTDTDVGLLVGADSGRPEFGRPEFGDRRGWLLGRRGGIEDLLSNAFEVVFGPSRGDDPLMGVSPFLAFAAAVHRTVKDLQSATYVSEWVGVGRRTPLFDVAQLREFVSDPWRRLFLAELLASYTHVASGSVVVASRRGLRRQRFSELDPVRLAGLLEVVPEAEQPGVLRRLGDLSLFLTGVFPDYVARRGFGPIEHSRLSRAGFMAPGGGAAAGPAVGAGPPELPGAEGGAVSLLGWLGRRWYRAAFELVPDPVPRALAVVGELPDRFDDARRVLAAVTERCIFGHRDRWFGLGIG